MNYITNKTIETEFSNLDNMCIDYILNIFSNLTEV